jgi:hypothetical protein
MQRWHHGRNQLLLDRICSQPKPLDRVHAYHFHIAGLGHNNYVWSLEIIARHPDRSRLTFENRTINRAESNSPQSLNAEPL